MPTHEETVPLSHPRRSPAAVMSARVIAGLGMALFVAGLSQPAVNLAPWLPGLNVFVLSFLGVVCFGGGSTPHFLACLLGAAANLLMFLVLIGVLAGRRLPFWMAWAALALSLLVTAPLNAIVTGNEGVVSTGYHCWIGCAALLVVASSLTRVRGKAPSAPSFELPASNSQLRTPGERGWFIGRQIQPTTSGPLDSAEGGHAQGELASREGTVQHSGRPGRNSLWSIAFVAVTAVLCFICANHRGETSVLLTGVGVLGIGAILLKRFTRSQSLPTVAVGLLLLPAAWWPTGGTLLQAIRDHDWRRARTCLILGANPNVVRTVVPHPWYLGTPGQTTPLYLAISAGEAAGVALLLRHRADPNLGCGEPEAIQRPLEHALAVGHPDIIRLIEQAGGTKTPPPPEKLAARRSTFLPPPVENPYE